MKDILQSVLDPHHGDSLTWYRTFRKRALHGAIVQEIAYELGISTHHVDCNTSFIRNGGDSLSAIKIASSFRSKGLKVTVAAILTCTSIYNLIDIVDDSHQNRPQASISPSSIPPRVKRSSVGHRECEATEMQLSLIHGSMTLHGRNIIQYFETYHTKDIPSVKEAWRAIFLSEPIFRTQFKRCEDKYYLVEEEKLTFLWEEVVVEDRESYHLHIDKRDFQEDFIGVAFKVVHLRSSKKCVSESTVVWSIHHALMDGYSNMLVLNKHRKALAGIRSDSAPSFIQVVPKIAILRDVWQPNGQEFWLRQQELLRSSRSDIQLPSPDLPFNAQYIMKDIRLGVLQQDLYQRAKEVGVTVASVWCAAWALALSHYVDSNHVSFGIVLSGRSLPLPEAVSILGPLINTVPFQILVEPATNVETYLSSVFRHFVELDTYQWHLPEQGITKNFPSTLNIHSEGPLLEPNPLGLIKAPHSRIISALPLCVDVHLDGKVVLCYHEHKFHEEDMDRLGRVLVHAVRLLLEPKRTLKSCSDALISGEMEILLKNGNVHSYLSTAGAWNENLVSLFDRAVIANKNIVAVEKGVAVITYALLQHKSTILAHYLSKHINIGEVVCVHADRTIGWVIAIFGILKAGGVYCPLDEGLPASVRDKNFTQSGAHVFLAETTSGKTFKPSACTLCLSVNELIDGPVESSANLRLTHKRLPHIAADMGAYLCFSSGSSGIPKGIKCTHRGLVAFQHDFNVRLRAGPGWRIAQTMSPAFDGSIHEIFSALSYGSTLVLRRSAEDPFGHLSQVDATMMTPSIAKVLHPGDFPSLKALFLVGEAVPQDVCDTWASKIPTYNMYGPTETTCGATFKKLVPRKVVTLGKPNRSTRIYILNNRQEFVPSGVIGEIVLAGVQVSLGYVQRPDMNAERFFPDPMFPDSMHERMYRTGDRGYWDNEGELRFCGRNDRQIKLHGFRLDLDDIETRVRQAVPQCSAAAVACTGEYLVAQLQPATLQVQEVKELLSGALPSYAIPRHITAVSVFPHTNAQKLDYKSIVEIQEPIAHPRTGNATSKLVEQLRAAWRDVLKLPEDIIVHEDSNFLGLGGDSLLQFQLASKLTSLFGYEVPISLVIKTISLGDLATKLLGMSTEEVITPMLAHGSCTMSPMEKQWWHRYQHWDKSPCLNVSLSLHLSPKTDIQRLTKAWNLILERHQILRSQYKRTESGTILKTYSDHAPTVERQDQVDVWQVVNTPFDLERDSLFRVVMTSELLFIVASHIICDYTALNLILEDVSCQYLGNPLKERRQYEDCLLACAAASETDLAFWKANLGTRQTPTYPTGNWKSRDCYNGSSRIYLMQKEILRKLRDYTIAQKVTTHQVVLAAVVLALQCHRNEIDIVVGAPLLGRTSKDFQDVIGLFLEPMPIRIRYPSLIDSNDLQEGNVSSQSFVRTVQACSEDALSHSVPWNKLLEHLSISPSTTDFGLFDVMVSLHDGFNRIGIEGTEAKPALTWTQGSKFKLMVEFLVANQDTLIMRLEYSNQTFDNISIAHMENLIVVALDMILAGASIENIGKSLKQSRKDLPCVDPDTARDFFNMPLETL